MYKIVGADDLEESEVHLYQEKELRVLYPGLGGDGTTEGPGDQEKGEVALETAGENIPSAEQQQKLKQDAYEEGMAQARKEGREEGKKDATEELRPAISAFQQATQSLIVLEEQLVSRMTPEIVRLALEIAAKVVEKQVEEDPRIVASVLERAREEIPPARQVRILLHPADHRMLAEHHPELISSGEDGGRKVEVVTSEQVGQGGCRIETEMGVLDATIPTQLEEIKKQMLGTE